MMKSSMTKERMNVAFPKFEPLFRSIVKCIAFYVMCDCPNNAPFGSEFGIYPFVVLVAFPYSGN